MPHCDNNPARGGITAPPTIAMMTREEAILLSKKEKHHIRFKWVESEGDDTYFEFLIQIDDLTEDVSLIVTDFAEEDEMEEAKMLWDSQIHAMLSHIGS